MAERENVQNVQKVGVKKNKRRGYRREVPKDLTDYSVLNPDGSLPKPFIEHEAFEVDTLHKVEAGWLRGKTDQMIDEFLDINPEEKEIMKLWNYHWVHNNYIGDCDIPRACYTFVDANWQIIVQKCLYKNFTTFLVCLHDYGLLSHQEVRQILLYYNSIKDGSNLNVQKDEKSKNDDHQFKLPLPKI